MTEQFIKVKIEDFRRENLRKLADYLAALPEDYQHFEMSYFFQLNYDLMDRLYQDSLRGKPGLKSNLFYKKGFYESHLTECGSAACAIGHAPAALEIELADYDFIDDWVIFSKQFLIKVEDLGWDWCFSGVWEITDNTPHGAAQRIYTFLDAGLPVDWLDQLRLRNPYRPSLSDYSNIATEILDTFPGPRDIK